MLSHHKLNTMKAARGFSLVELMLAMLVGLIIIGGVMSLYITSRDTQRVSQDQLQMVADARFVIQSIGYDIKHAGSWGGTMLHNNIFCTAGDARCPAADVLPLAIGDCAASDYINLTQPIFGFEAANPYGGTCASNGYAPNTDVLQLRYADPSFVATASLAADTTYVRSNSTGGKLFVGDVIPAHEGFANWDSNAINDLITRNYPLRSNTYYVSTYTDSVGDGIPSLRKASLVAGPELRDEVLLTGVQDFQIQYGIVDGINTNQGDFQSVVSYVNAGSVPDNVTWQNIKAVKIWVLMRTERPDRDGITGSQTFSIAGQAPVTFNDSYRRFLVSSVIKLRNTNRLDESTQAGGN